MNDVISLQSVGKTARAGQRDIAILEDISFTVRAGEFLAITGPSGCGKSTLLHLMGLLDRPSSGRVVLFGRSSESLSAAEAAQIRAESIGFIFQSFHLIPHLTVQENIALPLAYRRAPHRSAAVAELLERFELSDLAQAYPATLSGGEKQRAAIARALVNAPRLILADEPTGSLDSQNSRKVFDLLHEIHREGRTVLMVTHDLALASGAGRILPMQDGGLAAAA